MDSDWSEMQIIYTFMFYPMFVFVDLVCIYFQHFDKFGVRA